MNTLARRQSEVTYGDYLDLQKQKYALVAQLKAVKEEDRDTEEFKELIIKCNEVSEKLEFAYECVFYDNTPDSTK